MKILDRINPTNTVSFSRPIAHALGLNQALIYSALISKQEYYAKRDMLDHDGFFYSTAADLQESTTLTGRQQSAAIKSLISAGLVECKKCGMPARRFFRVADEAQLLDSIMEQGETIMEELNPIAQKHKHAASCSNKNAQQESAKCSHLSEQNVKCTYNPNIKKSKENDPDPSIHGSDGIDVINERRDYLEIIRENIEYDCFPETEKVDELVEIMLDVICSNRETFWVNRGETPKETVKSRFLKLNHEHINYVLLSLQKNTSDVRNIRSYLITALFNAPCTMDNYYTALFNHDMGGSA